MRLDIKVRMAQNEEGARVGELVESIFDMGGWQPNWEIVFPYWMVAEVAGELVGTINIRISIPFTSVEMMAIDPDLSQGDRGQVASMLTHSACTVATASGAQVISSMIPDELSSYLKVALHRGFTEGGHGTIVFGRLDE